MGGPPAIGAHTLSCEDLKIHWPHDPASAGFFVCGSCLLLAGSTHSRDSRTRRGVQRQNGNSRPIADYPASLGGLFGFRHTRLRGSDDSTCAYGSLLILGLARRLTGLSRMRSVTGARSRPKLAHILTSQDSR